MPVILAARVRVVRLLGHHARPQDAHACENVAGAALGPLAGTRLGWSATYTVGKRLGVALALLATPSVRRIVLGERGQSSDDDDVGQALAHLGSAQSRLHALDEDYYSEVCWPKGDIGR